jgi:putative membrane protein
MMYDGYGMGGGWGMFAMLLSNLVFLGLIVAGVVMLVRWLARDERFRSVAGSATSPVPGSATPQVLLAKRYARGEIDEEEYTRRLTVLGSGNPTRSPSG